MFTFTITNSEHYKHRLVYIDKLDRYFQDISTCFNCKKVGSVCLRAAIADIGHALCESCPQLKKPNRDFVARLCRRLETACSTIESAITKQFVDPLVAEIANMSRKQLFAKFGLFGPQTDNEQQLLHETEILVSLASRAEILQHNASLVTHANFKEITEKCKVLTCIIGYHLLILMIVRSATSKKWYFGVCACGECCGSVDAHAYLVIAPMFEKLNADMITDVCFVPISKHRN